MLSSVSFASAQASEDLALVMRTGNAAIDASYARAQSIIGNAGNNRLTGCDLIEGGLGNDVILAVAGWGSDPIFSFAHADRGVAVTLGLAGAHDTIGAGVDTIDPPIRRLLGSMFADILRRGADNRQ